VPSLRTTSTLPIGSFDLHVIIVAIRAAGVKN